jgi:hypothetical protein
MSVPATGLSYKQVQDILVGERFGSGMREEIKRWINLRYAQIWGDSEWPFKRVWRESWNIQVAPPTMPPAYWKTTRLVSSDGTVLGFLDPDRFDSTYPVGSDGGTPAHYTVLNSQIYLGPSTSTASLVHSYERRPCHFNSSDVLTPGLMNADDDYPVWPVDWHYALVVGATATGLKMQNDPTWDSLEQEFGSVILSMREDLLPPDQYQNLQYGRDNFV